MVNQRFLLFLLFFISVFAVKSQDIEIYDHFEDFAPLLEVKNDTTYVFNFWSTWCKPCVKEMPHFIDADEKFKGQKFKMIFVSLDFKTQLGSKVIPFVNEREIKAKVVLLADSKYHIWIDKVNAEWAGSIPMTIIFNKDFYFFKEGSMNFNELNEIISKNLIP